MALQALNNPCCKKKGTLVITIEPCTKEKETISDKTSHYSGERFIPGLPFKTARTMEIEVKIKGKDEKSFSEDKMKLNAIEDETVLVVHSPQVTEEKEVDVQTISRKTSDQSSIESEPMVNLSCKTIVLEKKPCSDSCPGPLICLPNKHFFGDRCKLHDPTYIGNQILAMHKKGLIRKRLYNNQPLYPNYILDTVSEINKKLEKRNIQEQEDNMSGDRVKPQVTKEIADRKVEAAISGVREQGVKRKNIPYENETKAYIAVREGVLPSSDPAPKDLSKRNRSGCFC